VDWFIGYEDRHASVLSILFLGLTNESTLKRINAIQVLL
jgi:hypothetical protein